MIRSRHCCARNLSGGYWSDATHSRSFFESFCQRRGILRVDDLYQYKAHVIKRDGGSGAICAGYGGSLVLALESVYPEYHWKPWKFAITHQGFWDDIVHHRHFLNYISKERLELQHPEDWYKLESRQLTDMKGLSFLNEYNGSLYQALTTVYPEYDFHPWRFIRTPRRFWIDPNNQRLFLDYLKQQCKIETVEDWLKISHNELRKHGGSPLLNQYESIAHAVNQIYYNHNSNYPSSKSTTTLPSKEQQLLIEANAYLQLSSKPERQIWKHLQTLHIANDWLLGYKHPQLMHSRSERLMELDFFSPSLRLAIEFQGEQHYQQTHRGVLSQQQARDNEKRLECIRNGITLIEIAANRWDGKLPTLKRIIQEERPDVIPITTEGISYLSYFISS